MNAHKGNEEHPQNNDGLLRTKWTEKNAFIIHSLTKCRRYCYKPKHDRENTGNIIRNILEAGLWDLLNSPWFAMVRKKVSMEHTVKNWRKEDENLDSEEFFLPSPDDEVPFYSQIVTGDMPLERYSFSKDKMHESKFIRTPLKNVYTFEVTSDLGDSDSLSEDAVERCSESGLMKKNVYPSVMPCHNIPLVVVSGIFESLMSELKLDLLGDCLDAIHDKKISNRLKINS